MMFFAKKVTSQLNNQDKLGLVAKNHGLFNRLHADEFNDYGGGDLAGEISATSADHLINVSKKGIQKLVENNVGILFCQVPHFH